jgi:hypothetical protein
MGKRGNDKIKRTRRNATPTVLAKNAAKREKKRAKDSKEKQKAKEAERKANAARWQNLLNVPLTDNADSVSNTETGSGDHESSGDSKLPAVASDPDVANDDRGGDDISAPSDAVAEPEEDETDCVYSLLDNEEDYADCDAGNGVMKTFLVHLQRQLQAETTGKLKDAAPHLKWLVKFLKDNDF